MDDDDEGRIDTLAALEALYGPVASASIVKQADHIHPVYRPFIAASPFVLLATVGPAGLDVSPRGDPPGFVAIEDDRTLILPDRRGNNRIDSLRNILADPRVALLFLVPGIAETLRVEGRAEILAGPALLDRFAHDGRPPRSLLRIRVDSVLFQCSRAVLRARLWAADSQVDRTSLPSTGAILRALSADVIDGAAYDAALPQRLTDSLY